MLRRRDNIKLSQYIDRMRMESEMILKEIMSLAYYMRGGLLYPEHAYMISVPERRLMHEFLQETIAAELKKPHPNY